MKDISVRAWCAVEPEKAIDIDMVRRSDSSARHAASNIKGVAWPQLSRAGWKIIKVRVIPDEEGEAPAPPPAPRRLPPAIRPASRSKVLMRCGDE